MKSDTYKIGDALYVLEDVLDETGEVYFSKGEILVIKEDCRDESHYDEGEYCKDGDAIFIVSVMIDEETEESSYEVYLKDIETNKILSKKHIREKGIESLLD